MLYRLKNLKITRADKIGFTFFISIVLSTTLIYQFEERFEKERWIESRGMRYKLVDDIIDRDILIGKTKDEVISLLGEPDSILKEKTYIYYIGKRPSFSGNNKTEQLAVSFNSNKVYKVNIEEY